MSSPHNRIHSRQYRSLECSQNASNLRAKHSAPRRFDTHPGSRNRRWRAPNLSVTREQRRSAQRRRLPCAPMITTEPCIEPRATVPIRYYKPFLTVFSARQDHGLGAAVATTCRHTNGDQFLGCLVLRKQSSVKRLPPARRRSSDVPGDLLVHSVGPVPTYDSTPLAIRAHRPMPMSLSPCT